MEVRIPYPTYAFDPIPIFISRLNHCIAAVTEYRSSEFCNMFFTQKKLAPNSSVTMFTQVVVLALMTPYLGTLRTAAPGPS